MHRQALNGREKVLGPDHPDTIFSVDQLGSVLADQTADKGPVLPIPAHMANMKVPISRSQKSSPTNRNFSTRTASRLPRNAQLNHAHTNISGPQYSEGRLSTPNFGRPTSPLSHEPEEEPLMVFEAYAIEDEGQV
ncbi:hypothetical protein BJX63DRAFT_394126 [Aspergillus granulosus]|uniref:Kinesin light chain n=1 Tax=Aspergillus granulosus TaxID=176169 RepID=A0ABR4HDL1_9EURO